MSAKGGLHASVTACTLCRCGHVAGVHRIGARWHLGSDTRCRVASGCPCVRFREDTWSGELQNVWMGSGRGVAVHRQRLRGKGPSA